MTDHSNLKLGKRARRLDGRTLKLARYLTAALPPAPPSVDWSKSVGAWGVHLNDSLGCCTIAAAANAIQTWTANAGQEVIVPDADVLKYYEAWDGYNPCDPSTDQGGVELDVLNNWRQQGFSASALDAFAAVNHANSGLVEIAINLFGGLYIGVELPLSAQGQSTWTVPASGIKTGRGVPGSWGGHCVLLLGWDAALIYFISWGKVYSMTWDFYHTYFDEIYAPISGDQISLATGLSRNGFDYPLLKADQALITH